MEKFTEHYHHNLFQGKESRSGRGSDLDIVTPLIPKLTQLFDKYKVETLIDSPCGDCHWMKNVIPLTKTRFYIGLDIVRDLIMDNKQKYTNDTTVFYRIDLVEEVPPQGDLILCRDCLVHLSLPSAIKVLKNIIASNTPLILLTTFTKDRVNVDFEDGTNWYPINLSNTPFNFPQPLELINEECKEADGNFQDKCLGLWKREDLVDYVARLNP
jgi:hypothetical protein